MAVKKAYSESLDTVKVLYSPRLTTAVAGQLKVVVDASSIELFADYDLSVMTALSFPNQPCNRMIYQKPQGNQS